MVAELFGLLTRIRVTSRPLNLEKAASRQFLFPIVGLIVGLLAALAALVLSHFFEEDLAVLLGGIVVVFVYFLTGIIHTEGLSDFADGLMAKGSKERKREVMKDVHSGVGGVFAVVVSLILYFSAVWTVMASPSRTANLGFSWSVLAFGLVLSEVAGKLAMNVTMWMGPSSHPGMGSVFVSKAGVGKLVASFSIALTIGFVLVGLLFLIVLLGAVAGVSIALLSRKHFGGVAGDSFGAANEIGRLLTIVAWVLIA